MAVEEKWLDRLARDLAVGGTTLIEDADPGVLRVDTFQGETENLPAFLEVDEAAFVRYLDADDAGAKARASMWPEISDRLAAYRLFLDTLDAVLMFRVVPGSRISFVGGRLTIEPQRPAEPRPKPIPGARWAPVRPRN